MPRIPKLILCGFAVVTAGTAAVFCTPSTTSAGTDETIHLTAYSSDGDAGAAYRWSVTGGKLQGNGAQADWILSGASVGQTYSATVTSQSGRQKPAACTVQVAITSGSRGDRETGRTLLVRGKTEESGYGLYSYLLFGSPPDDKTRDRYVAVLKEYLRLCPALVDLRKVLDAKQLNANYLPVMTSADPRTSPTTDWLLSNYDFARARGILKTIPGSHFSGPYILSTAKPVDPRNPSSGPMFFQDLSTIPPDLAAPWYEVFLNQAAQQRFWDVKASEQFTLRVRTIIGVLAQGLPDVKSSLASWIQWIH